MGTYKHLSIGERELIYLYTGMGFSIRRTAQFLKRNPSTVSRELKRHTKRVYYSPSASQENYVKNRKRCGRQRILNNPELRSVIESLFLDRQWSPEQIIHRLNHEGIWMPVSITTIYRAIYHGLFNSTLSRDSKGAIRKLRHKGKQRKTKDYIEKRGQLPISHTIHERPSEAETRSEIGHWEIDTVLGKQGKNCLVTLVDRKSRFLLAGRTTNKAAASINQTLSGLLSSLSNQRLKSITSDRGSEFAFHSEITKKHSVEFYFSDPYSPWQRGTNENTNGLIREYLPKRKDIGDYMDEFIEQFVDKLNFRPRKCLGWKTPYEVFYDTALHLI
ncbi:IS30 family transposase [Carnobacterium maltaromaticum]|uniref:IS30 family transposase n=1 Tax=Carnobacterium maltaromaticum TaxID=2751 RepID=UPI00298B6855|nr:IS30 family transposase [Carnobacterium maltaromaticum]MDW5525554.1 IS30 family transposase [Carnobacterium maltaromaticum]